MCHAEALKKHKTKNRKTETQTKVRMALRPCCKATLLYVFDRRRLSADPFDRILYIRAFIARLPQQQCLFKSIRAYRNALGRMLDCRGEKNNRGFKRFCCL